MDLSQFSEIEPAAIAIATRSHEDDLQSQSGFFRLSGLRHLPTDLARALTQVQPIGIDLSGLEELSPAAAHALAQNTHHTLDLSGLRSISIETARALALHRGDLNLSGLVTLTNSSAAVLALHEGTLHLKGIQTLSTDTLNQLSSGTGSLVLSGLIHLPLESIPGLASQRQRLDLSGLKDLSQAAAKRLSRSDAPAELQLDGLQTIGDEIVETLAGRNGTTSLAGFETISDTSFALIAQAVIEQKSKFVLAGLHELSHSQIRSLNSYPSNLHLHGLRALPVEAAEALLGLDLEYHLFTHLQTLSTESARVLAKHSGRGIDRSFPERCLAKANGRVHIEDERCHSLTHIRTTFGLLLRSLNPLTPEVAAALCEQGLSSIELNAVTELSTATAAAIAAGRRHVSLGGLKTLSGDAARALAGAQVSVNLTALTTLSHDAAEGLAACAQDLELFNIAELSPESARTLARYAGPQLNLSGLTHLDPDAAHAFEKSPPSLTIYRRPRLLDLSGLQSASDKTLNILLRNPRCTVGLRGMTELSVEVAKLCAAREECNLVFPTTLTSLTVEAAEALVQHKGTSMSQPEHWKLKLPGLTEIPASLAEVLKQYRGSLILPGVRSLSEESARLLCKHSGGVLDLSGIASLSDAILQDLAAHHSQVLLRGLTTLSVNGARALAKHRYPLHLPRIRTLSGEALRCLSEHQTKWDRYGRTLETSAKGYFLNLSGLDELTDEGAEALGTPTRNYLNLGFARISDRGLAALLHCDHLILQAIPETERRYNQLSSM